MPLNLGLCSLHLPSTANHGNWPLSGATDGAGGEGGSRLGTAQEKCVLGDL